MQHGDISDDPPQRLWVVYEGLVGLRRPETPSAPRKGPWRRRTPPRALSPADFSVNELAAAAIYRTMVRDHWHLEVLTFLGDGFALELAETLGYEQNIYAPVLSRTPAGVARELARRPDVQRVYFPDRANLLTFGQRGQHLPPDRADQIGRL